MFQDIKVLKKTENTEHFMSTVVGLCNEKPKNIDNTEYQLIEVVDGQQRLTTLIILLKALEKHIDSASIERPETARLRDLLIKSDKVSPILLQLNHDYDNLFLNYIRKGTLAESRTPQTLSDQRIADAIQECEKFVQEWEEPLTLLAIIENRLTFVFHQIGEGNNGYRFFEVLNDRGLQVQSLDRLKSILMSIAYQHSGVNAQEHIDELRSIWSQIYKAIGLEERLANEFLKFAATLYTSPKDSRIVGDKDAVELFKRWCDNTQDAIDISSKLLRVATAHREVTQNVLLTRANTKDIQQARLLAIAIRLRGFDPEVEQDLLLSWAKTTFRIFGLCRVDGKALVAPYVKAARYACKTFSNASTIKNDISTIGIATNKKSKNYDLQFALGMMRNRDCYGSWQEELRYLLWCYEQHLSKEQGDKFTNEQWSRIWESKASKTIDHIYPQSKGEWNHVPEDDDRIFVHRLGNLLILPQVTNSQLGDKEPEEKADAYAGTGLLSTKEVATRIKEYGWSKEQVEWHENKILNWITVFWS